VLGLEILEVTPDLERRFLSIAETDYCDYYFFIYDWLLQRSKTRIYLAQDSGVVAGLMVVFDGHIAQLRGSNVAVEMLLKALPSQVADVQVPVACEDLLCAKYPRPKLKAHVTLMHVTRGKEHIFVSQKPERLTAKDASAIAQIMHQANVELWQDITAEAVTRLFMAKEALWLGIKCDGKLAAFGYAMLTPKVCHVTWIATRPGYERLGYATSIVSSLVEACFAVAENAIIYVIDENNGAKGIYSKVGFRPYKSYVFVKA
jgi:ribosomal protein S18 acetylase RimI-like enzyme